jgi:CheY-like chemotaxis protein
VTEPLRVLILEDNPTDAELIHFELQDAGIIFTAEVVKTEQDFVRVLQEFSPDLILSDYNLPQYDCARALAEARRRCPDAPFIMVTGTIKEERAIEILTQGAKDYVLKSRLQQRLVLAVRRALAEAEEHRARKRAEEELRESHRTLEERVKTRTAELEAEMAARKKMEETLRESEERLRLLADNLPDSAVYQYIQESDGGVRFLYLSAGIKQLNGVAIGQALQDAGTLHRQIPPEYFAKFLEAQARSARDLSDFDMEVPTAKRRPRGVGRRANRYHQTKKDRRGAAKK